MFVVDTSEPVLEALTEPIVLSAPDSCDWVARVTARFTVACAPFSTAKVRDREFWYPAATIERV